MRGFELTKQVLAPYHGGHLGIADGQNESRYQAITRCGQTKHIIFHAEVLLVEYVWLARHIRNQFWVNVEQRIYRYRVENAYEAAYYVHTAYPRICIYPVRDSGRRFTLCQPGDPLFLPSTVMGLPTPEETLP
jgi:hypothetical protein